MILTQHQVRMRISRICDSPASPMGKARLLVRLGRQLSTQEQSLHQERIQVARNRDRAVEMGFVRMESHIHQLREDALDAAYQALHPV